MQWADRQPAIVIGLDDIRGVYAARTLASRGVPVIGIAKRPGSYGSRTNACREVLYADPTSTRLFDFHAEPFSCRAWIRS